MGKKGALEAILGKEFSTKILKEYIMKILFQKSQTKKIQRNATAAYIIDTRHQTQRQTLQSNHIAIQTKASKSDSRPATHIQQTQWKKKAML